MNAGRYLGPGCGVLAVVLVVVSEGITGTLEAEPNDSTSTMLAEFRTNADGIRYGAVVGALALGLLLVYFAHLRARFRDRGAAFAGDLVSIGAAALAVGVLAVTGARLAGAEAGDEGHGEVVRGAVDFLWNAAWLATPGLLVLGIGIAVASFGHRALPIWLGVFGVLVAVSALAPWVGLLLLALWVVAAAVTEIVVGRRQVPAGAGG